MFICVTNLCIRLKYVNLYDPFHVNNKERDFLRTRNFQLITCY